MIFYLLVAVSSASLYAAHYYHDEPGIYFQNAFQMQAHLERQCEFDLLEAVRINDEATTRRLVSLFRADTNCHILADRLYTPLTIAVLNKNSTVMIYLIRKGAKVDGSFSLFTPLHAAVEQNWLIGAQILIERGAHVDPKGVDEKTPLWYAVEDSNVPFIKFLIHNGADPQAEFIFRRVRNSQTGEITELRKNIYQFGIERKNPSVVEALELSPHMRRKFYVSMPDQHEQDLAD